MFLLVSQDPERKRYARCDETVDETNYWFDAQDIGQKEEPDECAHRVEYRSEYHYLLSERLRVEPTYR